MASIFDPNTMHIRTVRESDLLIIEQMNRKAVPHVNDLSLLELRAFISKSSFFKVIEDEETKVAGFMIVLGPGTDYSSENYQYFDSRYSSFDYIDRIVISENFRNLGFGTALYQFLIAHTNEASITCEVNIVPPNPVSAKFHKRLGFTEMHRMKVNNGTKEVSLLAKEFI